VTLGGKSAPRKNSAPCCNQASLRLEQVHHIEGSFFSVVEGSKV